MGILSSSTVSYWVCYSPDACMWLITWFYMQAFACSWQWVQGESASVSETLFVTWGSTQL